MLKETGTRSQTGRVPVFDVLCSILLYSGRIMGYDVKKPLKKADETVAKRREQKEGAY